MTQDRGGRFEVEDMESPVEERSAAVGYPSVPGKRRAFGDFRTLTPVRSLRLQVPGVPNFCLFG